MKYGFQQLSKAKVQSELWLQALQDIGKSSFKFFGLIVLVFELPPAHADSKNSMTNFFIIKKFLIL